MRAILSVFALMLMAIVIGCKDDVADKILPADNESISLSGELEKFLIDTKIDPDTKPDGQIRFGIIKNIDSLNIRMESNGNSLKGLEHFTNLKYLKFTGYQAPTNETNRYYYAFMQGIVKEYIPSLDTLDVSKNVKLEFLECSGLGDGGGYSSSVEYLKLGNNDQLKTIIARRTMMNSLDLSGAPNLENLDILECYNLYSVNICSNKKLNTLNSWQVKQFYISSLTSVKSNWKTGSAAFTECK